MKLILYKPQPKNTIYLKDIAIEYENQYNLIYNNQWLLLKTTSGCYRWFDYDDRFVLIETEKHINSFKEAIEVVKYYFGFGYKPDTFEVFKKGDIDIRFQVI